MILKESSLSAFHNRKNELILTSCAIQRIKSVKSQLKNIPLSFVDCVNFEIMNEYQQLNRTKFG